MRMIMENKMPAAVRSAPDKTRKATNVSLNEALLAEAKSLHINISKAAEAGLASAVAEQRALLWRKTNQAALESSNAYVTQHGLPLAKYRSF
jgi:antitoxin CcdA